MEGKLGDSSATGNYEYFVPTSEWVREEDSDTLLLFLPGFKKEQLRVQLTATRNLKISGQRPIGDDRWSAFQKEIPVSPNCDTKDISAKFVNSILYVKQPKLITPVKNQEEVPPANEPQPQQKPQQETTNSIANPTQNQRSEKTSDDGLSGNGPEEEKTAKTGGGKGNESADAKSVAKEASERQARADFATQETPEEEKGEKGESSNGNTGESGKMERGKAKVGNYKESIGDLAMKVKTSRKGMNWILLSLMALVLGIYVKNWLSHGGKTTTE